MMKAKTNIGILKHLSKLKSLDQIYKTPVLDYCDIIYHIPSQTHPPPLPRTLHTQMEKVERKEYQAAFVITGA